MFLATVTPIACFAEGYRSIRQHEFHIVDVEFRRLVRSVVGPPSGVCWSNPWHEIFHEWNTLVQQILEYRHRKSWRQTALCHHWKLAGYIANLPPNRWAKRALEWQPRAKRVGRRPYTWVTNIQEFTRWKRWGNWQNVAVRNVGAINAWVCTLLPWVGSTLLFSHLCLRPQTGSPLACRLDLDLYPWPCFLQSLFSQKGVRNWQICVVPNAGKGNILTTHNHHPAELVSLGGIVVEILERDRARKWVGFMMHWGCWQKVTPTSRTIKCLPS